MSSWYDENATFAVSAREATVTDDRPLEAAHRRQKTAAASRLAVSTKPGPRDWMDQAACTTVDPRGFTEPKVSAEAKFACRVCPVKPECLDYLLAGGKDQADYGAGLTSGQRTRLVMVQEAA
jgi:hypothetical protein